MLKSIHSAIQSFRQQFRKGKCYQKATNILNENIDNLHLMAKALVEYETLNSNQIDDIMAGAKPRSAEEDSNTKQSEDKKDPSVGDTAEQN